MSTPYRHDEDLFPAAAGEPADICQRLHAELESRSTVVILYVHGEIDAFTLQRWHRMVDTAVDRAIECGHLVVDISDTEFMACRSVLDLAARAQQAAAHGVLVSVVDPGPSVVARVVAVAGLTEWLPLHTTLIDALGAHTPRTSPCPTPPRSPRHARPPRTTRNRTIPPP